MSSLLNKNKNNTNENSEAKPTSGISLMKHNRLRVLSESSSNKIISSKNDLLINPTENFMYKKNITIAEKINQLKKKKYYLRKNNNNNFKSNSCRDINSSNSSNTDISNSEISDSPRHAPLLSAQSYSVDTKYNKNKVLEKTNTQIYNFDSTSDPSTLAQPIRQELQIKAKESISDVILACRSLIQTSGISNELSKTAYNFSRLDSVFSEIDNSIIKINENLNTCKQKNEDIMKSLNELNKAQEDSRRIKDLVVAYITE